MKIAKFGSETSCPFSLSPGSRHLQLVNRDHLEDFALGPLLSSQTSASGSAVS